MLASPTMLGVPIIVVILGMAIVGITWFRRITRGPGDGADDPWRFRR